MLKLHFKWRCEHLKERWNPLAGDKQYQDLDTYSRICIMHKLCHWRLELDDLADLLRVSKHLALALPHWWLVLDDLANLLRESQYLEPNRGWNWTFLLTCFT